jgi:hypothetical protein
MREVAGLYARHLLPLRSAALKADMQKVGETMLKEWLEKAGPDGQAMLDAYKK